MLSLLPRDPAGGGTWIAATDVGLAFVLLNVNPPGQLDVSLGGLSRGLVIPGLLDSVQDAFHASRIPNHDEQSVDMMRDDARTVSTAVIKATATQISMVYTPGAPRQNLVGTRYLLERTHLPGAA